LQEGVSPHYMLPSFPSLTFPNHHTMATGLHPESHGIVSNHFYDPALRASFSTSNSSLLDSQWWGGEPIWTTAERQGTHSAVHMWPGSESHIEGIQPSHIDKFNGSEALTRKANMVLRFLDLPGLEAGRTAASSRSSRPQLIMAYVPDIDSIGHRNGPNSTEMNATIQYVDDMMSSLFEGLAVRNLTEIVNVVVVSDHGMATTSSKRVIQLEDLVDPARMEFFDGWPLKGLRPRDPADIQPIYQDLVAKAAKSPAVDVYLRSNMPERFHYSNNDRIAPIWIVPVAGWAIADKNDFDVLAEQAKSPPGVFLPRGLHGYDNQHPLMRSIFVARGPAFPHLPGSRTDVFRESLSSILSLRAELACREHRGLQHCVRFHWCTARTQQRHAAPSTEAYRSAWS
jgi:predicted AlkP superfamily pyrophosphatase or phosphodiesterase